MAACYDEAIRNQHSAPYSGCGNCFELGSSSLDSRTMSSAMELAGERGSVAVRGYAKTAGGVSVDELGRIAKVVYGTVMDPNSYNLTGGVGPAPPAHALVRVYLGYSLIICKTCN